MKSEKEKNKKTKKRRLPIWMRVLLAVAAVFLAVIAVIAAYLNAKLGMIRYDEGSVAEVGEVDAEEDQDLDVSGLELADGEMEIPEGSPFYDSDVLNILLLGTDERTQEINDAGVSSNALDGTADSARYSDNARADSLILVSLNIKENTVKLVSIERGTGVPIDLPGYEGQYDWITHTFRYGGARLTMDTVERCFGVQVDHYVRINFNSFVEIVDTVGGVDITLTAAEANAMNKGASSNARRGLSPVTEGVNHMDGYTALQYARLRSIDSDWKRVVRQRTVIQAVLDKAGDASLTQLDAILNTVLPLVQTNFTKTEIASLLLELPDFAGAQAEQMTLPKEGTYGVRIGMNGRSMFDPDWAQNNAILKEFLYGGEASAASDANG